ncbi:BRCA1-associated RING domain protein 1-like [Nicotiana tomentosiformis]|uniref:BRCA1-associated RING domain protein 1-like n=1 Tax=Nicotiana tomentosiformis TaxID=4098 RepID=UPI00051C1976|nr:BRCA1-associated RING domain protein 1-like [Nicotiana tomentosiformis]XP_033517577.1 BRCA1-associated RING domain protein 1-like [Nicotiana tomentosiformis]XP_033517578.1 BRCA1-associated RING domain protein 1-like [Nicotiana tomentosiformis]XP_033517579.1 BRCA1-associated RING domain protein 1-like [Nicotiana tomentosiformis]
MRCIVGREDIFHERDVKRKTRLSSGSSQMSLESHGHIQLRCPSSEIVANSNCNMEHKNSESPSVAQPKSVSDQHALKGSVCCFCHSPKTTKGTGQFLYYANGKEVVENVSSPSKVICVHSKCIEWTPQVFYDGDTIKNLKSELARAAKLRCRSCGMKGAALGCYVKSCRRSYHVPCAFEIQDCRWDMDNYLMLCPIHKSTKFPTEKSKSRKHVRREVHRATSDIPPLTTEQLSFWARSSGGPKEWVLCGSALSSEEKYMLVTFANMCGATVCKFWKPNVTHVVAATDEKGACTRTFKVLMAILSGKWILTMDWVKACIAANGPVKEEPYEISLDNHGCSGGPKAGRLWASTNVPKLFDGFRFYLSGDFVPTYKVDLLDLVEKAGGASIQSKEQLVEQTHAAQETHPPYLVVYNCDPPRGCTFEEESNILQQRLAEAEDLTKQIGCQVIQHTWILECVAACKLVPFC